MMKKEETKMKTTVGKIDIYRCVLASLKAGQFVHPLSHPSVVFAKCIAKTVVIR